MKRVLVIVQDGPFNTVRSSEAFRMAMGLTLSDNEVSLLLTGDGVFHLLPLRAEAIGQPSIQTYMEYFPKVGVRVYAEAEALADRDIKPLPEKTMVISHRDLSDLLLKAEVVIPFR
ncbi:MAG: DsrE family protein [Candidatus Manganitrophaceae bacterium]